ncbi:MAG: beta-propeller fold lactonase family protein [Candidatus Sulfotelmatobacter sp.]
MWRSNMRIPGLRPAVLGAAKGSASGSFVAKSERSMLSAKLLSILATIVVSLGLTGCNPLKGLQVFCSTNCPPTPPAPEYIYATSTNHILAFTINQSSGALSAPTVAPGPNQSTGMVASMNGQLYVSDFLNNVVDGYSISSSGALTALASSPFSLEGTPPGAGGLTAFVQSGTYLYATDLNAGTVAGFLFDSTSGMLTPVPGSPFAAGDTPVQAALAEPQAGGPQFLYVSNLNDAVGGISAYAVNQQNGSLSAILGSPFPTGAPGSYPGPSAMVVSYGNNFLYVALSGTANANNQIVAFSINPTTGGLTALPQSPFTTGNDPLQMAYVAITANGQGFLYTANVQDGTISAFTADGTTGILSPVNGSPYTSGTSVLGLSQILTLSGKFFLYAADPEAETVNAYTINPNTGALTPLQGSPFPAGAAPMLLTSTAQ